MRKRVFAVMAGVCLLATALAAAPLPEKTITVQGEGVTVAVDAHGAPRGLTAEEIRQFASQFKTRPAVPRIISRAQGLTGAVLDESYDHHYVARINVDGSVSIVCTDDPTEAVMFASQAAPTDTIMRLPRTNARPVAAERE
jgi:hypothetical protein